MILGKPAERQGRKVKRLNGKPHDRLTAFLSKRTQSAFIFTKIRTERINNAYQNQQRKGTSPAPGPQGLGAIGGAGAAVYHAANGPLHGGGCRPGGGRTGFGSCSGGGPARTGRLHDKRGRDGFKISPLPQILQRKRTSALDHI